MSHQSHKKNVGIHSNLSGRLHQLTIEEKIYVSQEEIAEARKDLENLRKTNEGTCDDYKVTAQPCTRTIKIKALADILFASPGLPEGSRIAS